MTQARKFSQSNASSTKLRLRISTHVLQQCQLIFRTLVTGPRFARLRTSLRRFRFAFLIVAVFFGMVGLPAATATLLHPPVVTEAAEAWLHMADAGVSVRVYETSVGRIVQMPMNVYLSDVLAAEFPPTASQDSLRAGAVAARTYVMHARVQPPSKQTLAGQEGADVTDSSAWDLPFYSVATQQQKYPGGLADTYMTHIQAAIEATDGLILTSASTLGSSTPGQVPILAFTFAISPGRTRDARAVFGQSIPYLQSVACPDDAAVVRAEEKIVAASTVLQALHLPATTPLSQLALGPRDSAGFVTAVTAPNHTYNGSDVAARLGLPSADMTWKIEGKNILITTVGSGTNLGMSLHEALVLGGRGMAWSDILKRFYPGTTLQLDAKWM